MSSEDESELSIPIQPYITEACTSTAKFLEPPVTERSLSELDASKIICNPKLRHDINFDTDLHFRPNLEGEKGRKKKNRSDQFWSVLLSED